MKKNALLVAVVASFAAASAPTYAGYVCGTDSLAGDVIVSGFAPFVNGGTATFNITMQNLNGTVNCQIPPIGTYGVDVSGRFALNYTGDSAYEIDRTISNPVSIYAGLLNIGLPAGNRTYSFTDGGAGFDGTGTTLTPTSLSYDGATSADVLGLINSIMGTSFPVGTGSGTLAVTGTRFDDGFSLDFVESNLASGWNGFGALLLGADKQFDPTAYNANFTATGSGSYGVATGNFLIENARVHIPEPTTLALLGLGLLGLGLLRRRAV